MAYRSKEIITMKNSESPFHRYRHILLNDDYSAAETLQSFTLSCWNGATWKFRGDRLSNLDNEHLGIFLELAQQYASHGERDAMFMDTCREMLKQRRRWAAENKAKMDLLAQTSPDDYEEGPAEYWREMDEHAKYYALHQKLYLIE